MIAAVVFNRLSLRTARRRQGNTLKLLFSRLSDEWIPPSNSPLNTPVDNGNQYNGLEQAMEEAEMDNDEEKPIEDGTNDETIDWLKTRRSRLGDAHDMLKPGSNRLQIETDLEVLHHTLLSQEEISSLIQSLGGTDVVVSADNEQRMDGVGQILATSPTKAQLRKIAVAIVRQLRNRKLEECDVVGAQLGVEGIQDPDSRWLVVDCRNYVVHLQDAKMREAVNLEAIWSGEDPLLGLDWSDEAAVDDYVANNPVPQEYHETSLSSSFDWDTRMRDLKKNFQLPAPRSKSDKRNKRRKPRRR